jgi:hypothetical protein
MALHLTSLQTKQPPQPQPTPRRRIDLGYIARPQFELFHARRERWACLVCHRRAGKTVATLMDLIDAALRCKKTDGRFAYIAPTYAQAKDIGWSYLKNYTAPIDSVEQRESDLMVILPRNGARVRLYGAENYERLRGTYADGMVIDEYADMSPRAWPEVLRPSLADREGWATFVGTPKGRNDFWRLHEHAMKDPSWYSLVLRASQTGLIPDHELADMRAMLTAEAYAQEMECSFDAAILGAYFGRELAEAEAAGRITRVPYDPMLDVHTAWDLGIGDSTAIWFFQVLRDEVRVIDHYEASGYGLPHYTAVLDARGYRYGTDYVPHDAMARQLGTGRSIWETLHSLTGRFPRVIPQQSVMDGINAARVTMARCWFDAERCYDGLEALRAYRANYDERNKVFQDRPAHNWASHSADAFRYLSLAWREMAPEKPKPPPSDSWDRAFARSTESGAPGWRVA